jgi:hypothetical protein
MRASQRASTEQHDVTFTRPVTAPTSRITSKVTAITDMTVATPR